MKSAKYKVFSRFKPYQPNFSSVGGAVESRTAAVALSSILNNIINHSARQYPKPSALINNELTNYTSNSSYWALL
jgi:hypothetical protein